MTDSRQIRGIAGVFFALMSLGFADEVSQEQADLPADAAATIPFLRPVSAVDDLANASQDAVATKNSDGKESSESHADADQDHQAEKTPRTTDGIDIVPGLPESRDNPSLKSMIDSTRAAQIQLRFGVAESGNIGAFEQAQRLLAGIHSELTQLPSPPHEEEDRQRTSLTKIVEHLQEETAELCHDARQTLAGYFPLIRAFDLQLGEEDQQVHSYFQASTARRKAVSEALTKVAESSSSDAMLAIVLMSGGNGSLAPPSLMGLIDSQARTAFGKFPNVTLLPGSVRARIASIPPWDAPDPEFDPLCRQLIKEGEATKFKGVMIVLLREFEPDTHDGYWVQAQQRTYGVSGLKDAEDDADALEADKVRFVEAFTRDRSGHQVFDGGGVAILGLIAIAGYALWTTRRISPVPTWTNRLTVPAVGFLIGVILGPLVVLAMSRGMPEARASLRSSFWWPALSGALSLILPSGVMRLGLGTAGRYLPSSSCHGLWGISFVPVGIGVAAGWIGPASYVLGWESIPFVVAMSVAGVLLLYCFGRATDVADDFPLAFAPIVLVLSLPFGLGAFLGSALVLAAVAAVTGVALAVYAFQVRQRFNSEGTSLSQTNAGSSVTPGRVPRTLNELRQSLQSPLYQPADEVEFFRKVMDTVAADKTTWAGLVGPSAAGKSAAAEYLIRELRTKRPELRVLAGRCTEKSSAYQPFREALAEVGVPQQILTSHSQAGGMNDLFDRLADRFIPFWDFFSGYRDRVEEDHEDDAAAPIELQTAVAKALAGAAQTTGLVLFIDDVQWIDDWSAQMLEQLREQFPPGAPLPFLVLLVSREAKSLERYELDETIFTLSTPPLRRQKWILEKSLGIAPASAKRIVDAIGSIGEEPGGMFWLLRSVHELIDRQALTATSRGFALKQEYLHGEHLPMPDSMRQELAAQFRASQEHRSVLECAALLGEKFRVNDLAECLRMERLELLELLRRLEEEQQLVHDLPADPECYSFSSAFMLRIIRDELQTGGSGDPWKGRPTKIAREWHARIAAVLEQRKPRSTQLIKELAWHYVMAGPGCERQAVDFCLMAASAARRGRRTQEALSWLQRARHAARNGGIEIDDEKMGEFSELLSSATTNGCLPVQVNSEEITAAANSSHHEPLSAPSPDATKLANKPC